MDWKALKERAFSSRPSITTAGFRLPSTALEMQPEFVVAAKLDASARRIRRIAAKPLEPGALVPNAVRPNVVDRQSLRNACRLATEAAGNGGGRTGLLVSDGVVRAAILSFETMPADRQELEHLVRWRMKQSASGGAEGVRLSYQVSPCEPAGFEVFVLSVKESVANEYESILESIDGGLDLILPATSALLPLLPLETRAQLLLSMCGEWMTSVLVCGNRVCLWRTREIGRNPEEAANRALVTEAARVLASARDHMNLEVVRVWLCIRPPSAAELITEAARPVLTAITVLPPADETGAALPASQRSTFQELGAAISGLLMNG